MASSAILATPGRIAPPALISDEMDLCRTDVTIERSFNDRTQFLGARDTDLSTLGSSLLRQDILPRYLAKRVIEDGNVMLDTEANVSILIKGSLLRYAQIGGLERDRLVAICLRHLQAAIPHAMVDVAAPEDDQTRFELFRPEAQRAAAEGAAFCPPCFSACLTAPSVLLHRQRQRYRPRQTRSRRRHRDGVAARGRHQAAGA